MIVPSTGTVLGALHSSSCDSKLAKMLRTLPQFKVYPHLGVNVINSIKHKRRASRQKLLLPVRGVHLHQAFHLSLRFKRGESSAL